MFAVRCGVSAVMAVAVVGVVGCDLEEQGAPDSDRSGAATPSPVAAQAAPAGQAPGRSYPLRLSAGVAQPTLLPDGQAIAVGASYEWLSGGPEAGAQYFFAVRSPSATVYQPVQLDPAGGMLAAFLPSDRLAGLPEGPFEVAVVTRRMSAEGTAAPGEFEPLSEFVRCAE